MKQVLIILIAFVLSGKVAAQDLDNLKASRQLGLTYSSLGGAGLHFIVPTTPKDNVKFTGILIYRDDEQDKETFFSIGAEYQRDLVEGSDSRAYFALGTHLDNQLSNTLYFDYYGDELDNKRFFNAGLGLGFDYGNTRTGIVLNAHVSYQITTGLGNVDRTRVGLGGGLGIGFNF